MTSIRGKLRTGLVLTTLAAFVAAGVATDLGVRRSLMDDLDRTLRERASWVTSTIDQAAEGLELGFTELQLREFEPGPGASLLQLWKGDSVLFRSPSLAATDLEHPRADTGRVEFAFERTADGRYVRTIRSRFVSLVDPELEEVPPPLVLDLALGRDLANVEALINRLRALLAAIAIAAAAITLLVLNAVAGRSLRPLDRLAAEIAGLGARDLTRRVDARGVPAELQPMVHRLNELLDRLREAFERERAFSADIAHELRTPLAGLRSGLEVELSRPREADRYREALQESLAITLRMQDLVQTLLQLARLDAGLVTPVRAPADLAGITRAALEPLLPAATARRLEVVSALGLRVPVHTDPSLLSAAIRNLLDNAFAHSDVGGRVRVEVTHGADGGTLRVANTGSRVAQQDVGRLFDRFVRGDAARGAEGGHHGLGLPLVRHIAESLGCETDVRSEVGGEFSFTLRIPSRPSGLAETTGPSGTPPAAG